MLKRLTDEFIVVIILAILMGFILISFINIFNVLDFMYLLIIISYIIKYVLEKIRK